MSTAAPLQPEPVMTAEEVAAQLGVSRARVLRLVAWGRLPGTRVGSLWRFQPDVVRAYSGISPDPGPASSEPAPAVPFDPPVPGDDVVAEFLACESCGWCAPVALRSRAITQRHHVIPRAAGGSNDDINLVRLCPNCHVLAHELVYRRGEEDSWPKDRGQLFADLDRLYGRA